MLISLIVMIVIMGVLTAAMTGMFSTASVGTVAPTIGNNAYYSAESAYRYVLYSFLSAPQNSQYSTLRNNLNQRTLVLGTNSNANINIDTFFFAAQGAASSGTSLTVTAPVSFPSEYVSNGTVNLPSTGYLALEQSNNNPVRYTAVAYTSGTNTFTFTLATSRSWSNGEQVFPAFLKSGYSDPVTEGSDLTVGTGNLGGFPKKNGVFTLATTTGLALILVYERIDTSTTPARLVNIRSAADYSNIPSGGLTSYGAISYVALLPNARITVQGNYGDPSTDLYNQRVITYYQPMVQGSVATKQEYTDNFNNLDNWQTGGDEVGGHAITTVDDDGNYSSSGDNAMVVTSTEAYSTSLIQSAFNDTGVQESYVEYDPDVADFQEFWDKSDKKLSYEFQCKISFTADNDNAADNTKGTYMPGVLFRVRDTSIGNSHYVKEYYGMSFMRGLFDKDRMTDSTDSSSSNDNDADDIPDKHLFTDHGTNTQIPSSAEARICLSDYTPPATWNDKPPISGVPYIVFWQQALNYDEYDGAWHTDSNLYVDWLSYAPLCVLTKVTIYHYPASGSLPEGWYSGALSSAKEGGRSPVPYSAYKIERNADYGEILQPVSKTVNSVNVTILGDLDNTTYLIRDPDTMDPDTPYSGDVIQNAGFVFPEKDVAFQRLHNYKVYLKPWVTIMGRVVEMKGEYFDEDDSGCGNSEEDRINVIQAWFGDPDTNPRGTIKWMDSSSADFSQMVWPDYAYTSKEITVTYQDGWNSSQTERRLVERGDDEYTGSSEKRSNTVYSMQLTSDNYENIITGHEPAEIALHTYGIDASSLNTDEQDIVYFDDFALRVYKYGSATGLLPGVQSE